MGREILFRGKRKDNGEWIEGGYTKHDGKVFIVTWARYMPDTRDWDTVEYYENNPHYNSSLIEVLPETVCQYTGLTDKNGKKIFEGDILSAHLDDKYPEDITYVQITWDGFSWCMRESTEDDVMSEYDCNTFEVCGNIFDNKEF